MSKLGIKKRFAAITLPTKAHRPRSLAVVADTSFFGKKDNQWGVTLFRDPLTKENLWWKYVAEETVATYQRGRRELEALGYTITAITIDGLRGLGTVFEDIPVQFCHFHQKQIIRRYVTKHPKLQAGKDLLVVVEMLGQVSEADFITYLNAYLHRWKAFLNERTVPLEGKPFFTHQRLRSAIRSLITNLPNLFTYQKYPELNISTTTNSAESFFRHSKRIVNVHCGLKRETKEKVLETILLNNSTVKKRG